MSAAQPSLLPGTDDAVPPSGIDAPGAPTSAGPAAASSAGSKRRRPGAGDRLPRDPAARDQQLRGRGGCARVDAMARALSEVTVDGLDEAGVRQLTAAVRRLERATTALTTRIARHTDHLHQQGVANDPAAVLVGHGEVSARRARTEARRGHTTSRMPALADALDAGAISGEHIDTITRAAADLDEGELDMFEALAPHLATEAARLPVDTFGRTVRDLVDQIRSDDGLERLQRQRDRSRVKTWLDPNTGMGHLHAELDPERHAHIVHALDRHTRTLAATSNDTNGNNGVTIDANLRAEALTHLITWDTPPPDHDPPAPNRANRRGDGKTSLGSASDPGRLPLGDETNGGGRTRSDERAPDSIRPVRSHSATRRPTDGPRPTAVEPGDGCACGRDGPAGRRQPRLPSIIAVVDTRTLTDGHHPDTIARTSDGEPLPAATIDRYRCDALIRRVVLDPVGVPIDVGRTARTATPAQWAALTAVHDTCAWPGCTAPLSWCQAHHIREWSDGGRTDLHNLTPLCSTHHHRVHEGGWTIHTATDRTLTTHPPGRDRGS